MLYYMDEPLTANARYFENRFRNNPSNETAQQLLEAVNMLLAHRQMGVQLYFMMEEALAGSVVGLFTIETGQLTDRRNRELATIRSYVPVLFRQ